MRRPSKVVFMQNELGQLGGVSTFCKVVGEGLLARGLLIEIGALEPARHGKPVAYDQRIHQWVASDRSLARARTERGPGMRTARRRARKRFSSYDSDTIVIFTQLFVRERLRTVWQGLDHRSEFRSIAQYHGSFAEANAQGDVRRARAVFSDVDLFLLLTSGDAELFRKAGFNNTAYVPNPIEVGDVELADIAAPIVVSLGRYEPIKGLDQVIKAWGLLVDDFPQWRLRLYGDGPLREQLTDLVRDLKLSRAVELMGRTENVKQVLADASVNVMCSRHEGLPFALMEASVAGVPSVSYDSAPGVHEIIADGFTGLITDRNDPEALAKSLRKIMANVELRRRMGAAARLRMQEKFELGVVLDRWEELFDQVLR